MSKANGGPPEAALEEECAACDRELRVAGCPEGEDWVLLCDGCFERFGATPYFPDDVEGWVEEVRS